MIEKKKMGRPPGKVEYIDIEYNGKQYIICKIFRNNVPVMFLFDKGDEEKVKSKIWHCTSAGYIASRHCNNGKESCILLHRFIMNKIDFPGKGTTESVDHINRNPLDNRKENLRVISQTEQNLNQKRKPRNNIQLPENSGLTADDIPKHVWYIKPNGSHGDRFGIDLKTENITWKSSASKKISLQDKLYETKQKLAEFYIQYPYLDPYVNNVAIQSQELCNSFQEIINLANI